MDVIHIQPACIAHAKSILAKRAKPHFVSYYVVVTVRSQVSKASIERSVAVWAKLKTDAFLDSLYICVPNVNGDIFPGTSANYKVILHILVMEMNVIEPLSA